MFLLKNKYKLSDEQLVKLISKQQDHKAFEIIYDRYHQRVFTYFLRATNSKSLAEDLLQEIFTTLWEKAEFFDSAYDFRPWFYTLGSNILRKQFRQPMMVDLEGNKVDEIDEDSPSSIMIDAESTSEIKKLNDQLPPHLREVFWLRIIEEFSVKEVSKIVKIPEGTVKSRLSKAIKIMKEIHPEKNKYYA